MTRAIRQSYLRRLGVAAVVSGLWIIVVVNLTEIFTSGVWSFVAIAIAVSVAFTSAFTLVFWPRRTGFAAAASAVVGGAILLVRVWSHADFTRWAETPVERIQALVEELRFGVAPMQMSVDLESLLLLVILLGAWLVSMFPAHSMFSAVSMSLSMLVVPIITNTPVRGDLLLGAGVSLAVLMWVTSPRMKPSGLVAAFCALVLAAGAVTFAPSGRDRQWNDSVQLAPVGLYVDDVTVELAQDLRERSYAPVFTFTSSESAPMHFRLATLSSFEGGTWAADEELDWGEPTVETLRTPVTVGPSLPRQFDDSALKQLSGGNRDQYGRYLIETPPGSVSIDVESGSFAAFQPIIPEWEDHGFDYRGEPQQFVNVQIENLKSSWLPLPIGAAYVSARSDQFSAQEWLWASRSNTARSTDAFTRRGDQFRVSMSPGDMRTGSSSDLRWLPAEMLKRYERVEDAPGEVQPYLELPGELPHDLQQWVDTVESPAMTRLDVGTTLELMFTDGEYQFTYDETAPYLPGADPASPYSSVQALLETRAGFCVHYATTFAVLARSMGVPTRIGVGYAARAQRESQTVVRGADLHAWPEIYVDHVGWVPFEPTPGGAWDRAELGQTELPREVSVVQNDEAQEGQEESPEEPVEEADEFSRGSAEQQSDPADSERPYEVSYSLLVAIGLLGVLAVLLIPLMLRKLLRFWRVMRIRYGSSPAQAAWQEMIDTARDYGLSLDTVSGGDRRNGPRARTPEAIVEFIAATDPSCDEEVEQTLSYLAQKYVREEYGAGLDREEKASTTVRSALERSLCTAIDFLRVSASVPVRAKATFWPKSLRRNSRNTQMPVKQLVVFRE